MGRSPAEWRPQNLQQSEERKPAERFELSEASIRWLFREAPRGGNCFTAALKLCNCVVLGWSPGFEPLNVPRTWEEGLFENDCSSAFSGLLKLRQEISSESFDINVSIDFEVMLWTLGEQERERRKVTDR